MALFGIGNLLLKAKRRKLPRPVKASILSVLIAVFFIIIAFYGNILLNEDSFYTFLKYLFPALLVVVIMLNRTLIIRGIIATLDFLNRPFRKFVVKSNKKLHQLHRNINEQEFVFFTKKDNVAILNKVMQYVEDNETTRKLKIVNVMKEGENNDELKMDLRVLDRAYQDIDIDFIEIIGEFTPELIEELSLKWKIPKNFMFIASPSDRFSYRVADLGGVRLIM
jgi:hypothetical protein